MPSQHVQSAATCLPRRSHISRPRPISVHACNWIFQPIKYTQKSNETLEMHNKSIFAQKNVKPIFIVLSCLALPRKNTKPSKKTNMPLGKFNKSKLYLFN